MSFAPDEATSREDRLDAIIAELVEAAERGETPDPAPYFRQHPDLADELRTFLQDWRHFQFTATTVPPAARPAPIADNTAIPPRIGNYEVLGRIARGGMGVVYKARQMPLNRTVAVKMLLRGASSTPDEIRRFQAEAEAAAQLDHPGIVPIYEVGQHEGLPYFSMRYIAGENLADLVTHGPLDAREAARLVREIALALDFAHQHQVVHRDLKPSNVLLEWPGDDSLASPLGHRTHLAEGRESAKASRDSNLRPMPRITDFGLAKCLSAEDSHTQSGQVLGTPSYMSPEQIAGRSIAVGPTTDIYSLGAILYCLLTGRPPFQAADPLDTLRQVCDDDPVPPSKLNPSTPRDLETIALRCLEKNSQRRFGTAQALAEELERFLEGRPILTRPVGWIERVARWSRRQPVVAALVVAVTSAVILGAGTSAYFGLHERQRRRELEHSLYRSQVTQADLEWQTNNVNRADDLLDDCEPRLRNWEWNFLKRRCHLDRLECRGQDERIRQVAFSPNGDKFVTAGSDGTSGTVRCWDANTGAALLAWPCGAPVMTVAWSRDGESIAAGLKDGRVVIWDVPSSRPRFAKPVHQGSVYRVAFHPASQLLATCGEDGWVRLLDTNSGSERFELEGHSDEGNSGKHPAALCLAFDASGLMLAAAGENQVISIWHTKTGRLIHSLDTGPVTTRAVAFTIDGQRLLAAGNDDNSIRTWDLPTHKVVASFEEHSAPVRTLAISPNGSTVASGGKDGTVMVWETETGDLVRSWKAHNLLVDSVTFRPNGQEVASCGIDNLVRVWNLDSPAAVPHSAGHTDRVNEIAFSPSGDIVASASKDGTVRLWDARTAEERGICGGPDGHVGMVLAVVFSRQGQWLASAGEDGQVLRWDSKSGQRLGLLASGSTPIWSVDVHPDSTRIAFGGDDGQIVVCDVDGDQRRHSKLAHAGGVKCVRFSPDGKWLASCGEDATVRLWNAESGEPERTLQLHVGPVWNVAFSRDGRKLASCGSDGMAVIWDLATGHHEQTCEGHAGIVYSASFSADGSRLATAGFDQTVKLWELTTGHDLLTLRGPIWSVNSVAFSPDGQTIASGSSDWRVRLWHATWPRR